MKIPNKIKVAGHYYKVKWDDKRLSEEGLVGESSHNLNIIYLCKYYRSKKARAESEIEETLIHEIVHTVDVLYNNHSLNEKEVNRLSIGLHQVLTDNFIIKTRKK